MSLPTIQLTGGAVADPELRFTSSGKGVCTVRVVCKSQRKEGAEWVDGDPLFISVVCWAPLAEHLAESVTKGDQITCTGELKQREWTTPEGDKRTTYEVNAREVGVNVRFTDAPTDRVRASNGVPTRVSGPSQVEGLWDAEAAWEAPLDSGAPF